MEQVEMVEVQVGKQYSISNRWKKSFIETTYYVHSETNSVVERETLWRSGSFLVTPQNQDEVDVLMLAQDENYSGSIFIEFFEEFEFDSCWDGICDEYRSDDIEDIDDRFESFYEDDELQEEYFGFEEYLEECLGYELDYSEQVIEGSILVELRD